MGEDGLPCLATRSSPSRHPGAGQHRLPRPGRHLHAGPGPRPQASTLFTPPEHGLHPSKPPPLTFCPPDTLPLSGTLTAAGGVSFKPPLLCCDWGEGSPPSRHPWRGFTEQRPPEPLPNNPGLSLTSKNLRRRQLNSDESLLLPLLSMTATIQLSCADGTRGVGGGPPCSTLTRSLFAGSSSSSAARLSRHS